MPQSPKRIIVTSDVATQFLAIKQTNECNMLDTECVKRLARKFKFRKLLRMVNHDTEKLEALVFGTALVSINDTTVKLEDFAEVHDVSLPS